MESKKDYRDSHQGKGGVYDDTIFSSALDAYMDRWEANHLLQVLPRLFPERVPRYLDFACGTGRITQRVESYADEACGVDVSESMLSVARGKCRATRFVCADLTRSELEPGPFDLVTAFRFFGNAQDDLRAAALTAIHQRLRPGGFLIINNHRNPRSLLAIRVRPGQHHGMDLSHAKLRSLLSRHGFEIVHRRAIGFWIYRYKMATAELFASAWAARLEQTFQYSCFAPLSPDALIVARKTTKDVLTSETRR